MQINFKLRKICKWLCTFIKGKSALMAIWQKRTERTFDSVPPLNILHLVEHHVRPFFKNYAPLHSSYWHIWFFLRLTLINSCCQLQARSSQPEQKVSAFLSFFLSFFHWRLVSHQCLLCPYLLTFWYFQWSQLAHTNNDSPLEKAMSFSTIFSFEFWVAFLGVGLGDKTGYN